nr:LINE-type retrotransposon LIb DNA [Ipomoea batatas]
MLSSFFAKVSETQEAIRHKVGTGLERQGDLAIEHSNTRDNLSHLVEHQKLLQTKIENAENHIKGDLDKTLLELVKILGLHVLERKLIEELNEVLKQKEVLWFQKSRREWILDGDKNTAFYHRSTLIRRNRARICMLKINGMASWGWRGILRGCSIVEAGATWKVGNGHSLNFWSDWWVTDKPLGLLMDVDISEDMAHAKASDLILNNNNWDINRLQDLLPCEVVNKIRANPIPTEPNARDCLHWPLAPSGKFSVQATFQYIAGNRDDEEDTSWISKLHTTKKDPFLRVAGDAVVEKATAQAEEARDLLFKRKTFNSGKSQWISWQPPEEGWIKCNTDGAFKKGSGLVSAGGLFRDHKGSWILGFMSKIGDTNSFAAELWDLREGLRLAKARAVINAMRREEDPRKPSSTLIQDFNFLRGCMREIKFSHTLREGNTSADRLVNLGQAVDWGASVLDHPPEALENLLLSDAHGALIQSVR